MPVHYVVVKHESKGGGGSAPAGGTTNEIENRKEDRGFQAGARVLPAP